MSVYRKGKIILEKMTQKTTQIYRAESITFPNVGFKA